ncbi:hypothetical protein AAE478_002700 [Parahypoxylon ruwenzoriense]
MGSDGNNANANANSKKMHPFFSAAKNTNTTKDSSSLNAVAPVMPVTPDPSCSPNSDNAAERIENDSDANTAPGSRQRKRRRTESYTDTKQPARQGPRPKRQARASAGTSIADHFGKKSDDGSQLTNEHTDERCGVNGPPAQVDIPVSGVESEGTSGNRSDVNKPTSLPKPQKLLKLNTKSGTIGSPPRPKPTPTSRNAPITEKAGSKRVWELKTYLVSIRYGQDDDTSQRQIGQQINDILANIRTTKIDDKPKTLPNTPPSSRDTDKSSMDGVVQPDKISPGEATVGSGIAKKSSTPKKPTHPFFQARKKLDPIVDEKQKLLVKSPAKRQTIFTSTPCPPERARPTYPKFNIPTAGMNTGALKVPGAQHPAWPWKGIVHVRGDTPCPLNPEQGMLSEKLRRKRKAKGQRVEIAKSESILQRTALNFHLKHLAEELKASDTNDFQPPSSLLRIPSRHFESGKKLQARVAGELKTLGRSSGARGTHPALTHAYNSIQRNLSAFDRSTCETSTWAQKYAPSSAECILQSGREAELLRDWLRNLKVLAIDTGTVDPGAKSKASAPAKAKRKRNKLDGFVVSSDEEMDELGEISEPEGDWSPGGSQGTVKKTVIRSSDATSRGFREGGRLTNAVVLSGPHGCGKTATVYAIAKELDFEVFEINSGARRSGKDILERVGDMTRNHLVQHHHKEDAREEAVPEDEVSRDLKSGKQGMMTTFFKPKLAASQNLAKKPACPSSAESSVTKEIKKPAKVPKQSVILLEEVDILYEEDKQFWATVISMISQSKRPFVMTCNDETLVPLHNLNLHGIFRFSSPPEDLAVDLLLLIAANEGHALQRRAVETLYDSRNHDLRASITELNYWCQIGVGDLQGGFNWFYPRWPKGNDVDEQGDTVRVVSQDTYQTGMGWLNRDPAVISSSSRSAEEELHQQICENWSFDIYDSHASDDRFSFWVTTATKRCSSPRERLDLLELVDSFASLMSDADLGSAHRSTMPNLTSMDASSPSLPTKAKEDFIVGRQLLEVSPSIRYDTTPNDISTVLKNLAGARLRGERSVRDDLEDFGTSNEGEATAEIAHHLSRSLEAEPAVTRFDFSLAFDPIAASEKPMAAGYLDPSVFDRSMQIISLDIAPYVRSIVAYDQKLQQERLLKSNLLSEGGKPGKKRMRTTRSAYSALEGGSRAHTRRERYFSVDINPHLVMRTGGKGWGALVASSASGQSIASGKSNIGNPCGEIGGDSD